MLSPLTNQPDTERLAVISPAAIAERYRESLGVDVGPAFSALPSIEYWRSKTTGLAWYAPPEAAGGGELYAQLERFGLDHPFAHSGHRMRRQAILA